MCQTQPEAVSCSVVASALLTLTRDNECARVHCSTAPYGDGASANSATGSVSCCHWTTCVMDMIEPEVTEQRERRCHA